MQTVVGVLRGGLSREHEASLRTGAAMLAHLPQERFVPRDIYIDKRGVWYDRGRAVTPDRVLHQIDVALIALHGEPSTRGEIQRLLERFGVPYAGSDSFASYLAAHKILSKTHAQGAGIKTPDVYHVEGADGIEAAALEITRTFHQPVIVKSIDGRSANDTIIVGGYAPIVAALTQFFIEGASGAVVEEYIRGREATVVTVEGLRGEELYTTPVVEGHFSRVDSEELQRLARLMHRTLGLRHYSQSRFAVTPKNIYYLETETLPSLGAETHLARGLSSVGVRFPDFLSHLVNLAQMR